tara:strand:- start:1107 stop:1502 length:396 start_codon:yes stop_codon:yes gene_type:complete
MSVNYVVYNDKGSICRTGVCSVGDVYLQAGLDESAIMCEANDLLQYVEGGAVKMKQPLGVVWSSLQVLANGVDEIVLDGLPIPCTVYVDGEAVEVLDGNFEFSTEDIGSYNVKVDHPKYLIEEWRVEANEV